MSKKIILTAAILLGHNNQTIAADTLEEQLQRATKNGKIIFVTSNDNKQSDTFIVSPEAGSSYNPQRQIPSEIARVAGGILLGMGLMAPSSTEKAFLFTASILSIASCLLIQSQEHAREYEQNKEAIDLINEQLLKTKKPHC